MAKKSAKPKKSRAKSGRPSAYDAAFHPDRAYKLALLGCTNVEIAEQFGLTDTGITGWIERHPEFKAAIHAGRVPADSEVADALRKRALGFEWEEEVATKVKVDQHREEVVITKVKRIVPPDTMAASLWLRNRKTTSWQEKA